jgi:hypothetical protein
MFITDLVVLAIDAPQVAVSEENVANASLPRNYGLFSTVYANGTDLKRGIGIAISQFPGVAVGPTFPGT